ncbi:MAG: HAD-IIIA family hydrolase [Verrucomicrobiales bacterium]|nr:HAD-IIIA family hydrolase [Verrucomicrobiales bacterium]
MNRAFFFDRDGVINASPGEGRYVLSWEDFHFLPGLREVLAFLKAQGWVTVVVTNQQCVAKGLISRQDLDDLHRRMNAALGPLAFAATHVCPHPAAAQCPCRKPQPGMARQAAAELALDLSQSWLVGDHDRDIEFAGHAGIGHAVRFVSEKEVRRRGEFLVHSHAELLEVLRRHPDFAPP